MDGQAHEENASILNWGVCKGMVQLERMVLLLKKKKQTNKTKQLRCKAGSKPWG